jgi:protein-S-isoprenylcysteine O-methyltransferase Ste14
MRAFIKKHSQLIVNWVVFIGIGKWIVEKAHGWHQAGELWQFVEITFLARMAVLLVLVIIRTRHIGIDRNVFHQAIALVAFFSGLAFVGEKTANESLLWSARTVMCIGMVLGIMTQINLGRSFGILIARRRIKTKCLYGIVRHPMYFTDILFKIGMFLKMPSWGNTAVLVLGVACYVYRAIQEERFLAQSQDYREYMKKVRYRLLPGVF